MTDTLTHTDQIPRELRALPRWCVTQVVRKGETSRKLILTPGMAGKRLAASDDPGTWRDFETARRDAEARGLYLTFVFDRSLPYFFIDADEVVSPTGEITDWAQDLVEGLETYTEVSASGDGLHIIGRGAFGERSANPAYPVERYPLHGPRFCLFTGQTLPGHDTIEERAHHLAVAFPERAYHTNGATSGAGYTGPVGELSPAEVGGIVGEALLERGTQAPDGGLPERLSGQGGGESRADVADHRALRGERSAAGRQAGGLRDDLRRSGGGGVGGGLAGVTGCLSSDDG
jgi:hypothetical protein